MSNSDEKEYYLRKRCCSGKVYGRFTLEELKKQFGYEKDPSIKDMNDLQIRLIKDYNGFDFPYYIESV